MKKIAFLIVVMILAKISLAQTPVSGIVSGTWTQANSPYQVTGALMVANGTTLTIQPGVTVQFQGAYKFLVLGQVLAVGYATDSIIFTASNPTTGWLGIRFDSTAATNDTSRFGYCRFEYGNATGSSGIVDAGAIYLIKFSKAVISHSLFQNCTSSNWGGCIYCNMNSNARILDNRFNNNTCTGFGGGAIAVNNSTPKIERNIFYNNTVSSNGRGAGISIYGAGSSALIYGNQFLNNTTFRGGGVFSSGGSPVIELNTFLNNTATAVGSGISCEYSSPLIAGNYFGNNTGAVIACEGAAGTISWNRIIGNNGFGIDCFSSNTADIHNNTIANNTKSGVYLSSCSPTLTYDSVMNNTWSDGGGIYCTYASPVISNCLLSNNTGTTTAGALYCSNSSPTVKNCTFANNLSTKGGAVFCTANSDPTFSNSILWGDSAGVGPEIYLDDEPSDPTISYTDLEGGSAGIGTNTNVFYLGSYSNNINQDPMFGTPTGGKGASFNSAGAHWMLSGASPCVNAGGSGTFPSTDLAGNPRVNGTIDMGCYEYQGMIGISDQNSASTLLSLYPNPAYDRIALPKSLLDDNLNVYNAQETHIDCQRPGLDGVMNISNLSNGVYFLSNGQVHLKFVVHH